MKKVKKIFKITDKYWIESCDALNWVITHEVLTKKKEKVRKKFGYYRCICHAQEAMADLVATISGNYEELEKWVDKIKEIKVKCSKPEIKYPVDESNARLNNKMNR